MNQRLIEDERHRNPMSLAELEARMRDMLAGAYVANLFAREGRDVAYALWRAEGEWISLRQFYVEREARRAGIGREAIALLARDAWPRGKRVRVSCLVGNEAGLAFWRAVGFGDYMVTLEMDRG